MVPDDTIEHAVLGVARRIHRLGGKHAQQYRARCALPMPKVGYAGSGGASEGAPNRGADDSGGGSRPSRIALSAPMTERQFIR